MSTQLDFYRARADDARRDASAAQLANVRDRCLRAATAWDQMAIRAAKSDKLRAEADAAKAARTDSIETDLAEAPIP